MTQTKTPVREFFDIYARETAEGNMEAIVSHFTDPFLSAGPSGTQSVHVADFAAAVPKRKALFDRLGSQPAQLVGFREAPLDSRYVLVRTSWQMSFVHENIPSKKVDVESTYLIDTGLPQTDPADFKILLYLTHQDVMQILRDRGILEETKEKIA